MNTYTMLSLRGGLVKKLFSSWRWRRPVLALIAVLVVSGLTLGGIAVFGSRTKPAANCPVLLTKNTPGQVAISESDNGQIIDINTGDQLLLDLTYVPTTGNTWSVRENSNPAVLSEVKSIYNPNDV
jgi:hypothetical protein